jgi:hypothetical protein
MHAAETLVIQLPRCGWITSMPCCGSSASAALMFSYLSPCACRRASQSVGSGSHQPQGDELMPVAPVSSGP